MKNRLINLLGSICFCWGVVACTAEPPKELRSGEIWPDHQGVHVNAHGGGILYHDGTYIGMARINPILPVVPW